MSQTSTYGQVRALGQAPSAPKQWKSDVHVQSKTLSAQREITTDEIQESKIYGECSNLKSTCVCALTGSVPRKMPRVSREFQHPQGIKPEQAKSIPFTLTT